MQKISLFIVFPRERTLDLYFGGFKVGWPRVLSRTLLRAGAARLQPISGVERSFSHYRRRSVAVGLSKLFLGSKITSIAARRAELEA